MVSLKNQEQLKLMKEAGRITGEALVLARDLVKEGVTTKFLDRKIREHIEKCGAKPSFLGYGGFPASACISVNEVVVHGIPSEEHIIKEGDIVSVDLVAYKNGFHGDAARTFCIGEVSEEKRKLVKVTEECFFRGIEGLRAGTPLYDIGYKVQQHAESHGYGVIRSYTGHGIGKEMHEDPSVPNFGRKGTGVRLKSGMTLCIEPMISMGNWRVRVLDDDWTAVTIDSSPAAHYENTVLIKEDGVEILTL
jgi:methionyl aminopeptidase